MSILNDLFQQIIQSEERIRERFSKIREVNMEIQVCQMKFQDSEDELKSITGSQVLKNQRLAEEELKCQWFGIRENILREKKTELVKRKNCFKNEKEKIEDKIESERDKFTIEVGKFMGSYDFCEKGQEQRVIKAKTMLKELCNEKQRLLKGIALVRQTQEQVASLVREKDQLLTITNKGESTLEALTTQLQTAADETTGLGIDKQRMFLKPQNDPEFKRLADELESMKDDTMEGICEALTQELHELQQIHLKNELRKKKQQQKERNQPCLEQVQSQPAVQNKGRIWRQKLNRKQAQNSISE